MAGDEGFFSRWSRRKSGIAEPAPVPAEGAPPLPTPAMPDTAAAVSEAAAPPSPPPPTLDDVAALDPGVDDLKRFVAADVDPSVRNAALKKLFAQPQWNVMDGLDVYIDDYGKPDPLPPGMLRRMAQARVLKLFEDDEEIDAAGKPVAADADNRPQDALPPKPDENADLRLQPDDAAGRDVDPRRPREDPGDEP